MENTHKINKNFLSMHKCTDTSVLFIIIILSLNGTIAVVFLHDSGFSLQNFNNPNCKGCYMRCITRTFK